MVTTPLTAFLSVKEELPSGGMTEEVGQPMQGVQATQGLEASQLPVSQDPQPEQTFSPIKTMLPEPVLSKETLGASFHPHKQVSPHLPFIRMLNLTPLTSPSLSFFWSSHFSLLLLGQTSLRFASKAASSLESEGFEGACCSPSLCFLFFPLFMLFLCLFLLWRSP